MAVPVQYSCDMCDKEFNLKIKLKKHMLLHETEKCQEDYLDQNIKFSDEEKIFYKHDLKLKVEKMREEIMEYEKKFEKSDKTNCETEVSDSKGSKFLNIKVTKNSATIDDFDEVITDDETIPTGWTAGYVDPNLNNNNQGKQKAFLTADGKLLYGRRIALLYMINVLRSPKSDVEKMKRGFVTKEGFTESLDIPEGWLIKITSQPSRTGNIIEVMTDNFDLRRGINKTLAEMISRNLPGETISKFISSFSTLHNFNGEEIVWKEDPTIPKGWRIGKTLTKTLYITKTGHIFTKRLTVIKHIRNSKVYNMKTKKELFKYFQAQPFQKSSRKTCKDSVWVTAELLPTGWKKSKNDDLGKNPKFQGPDGKYYQGLFSVIKALLDIGEEVSSIALAYGWSTATWLPKNWFYKKQESRIFFLTDKGEKLKSYMSAAKFIEECFDEKHVEKFKSGLKNMYPRSHFYLHTEDARLTNDTVSKEINTDKNILREGSKPNKDNMEEGSKPENAKINRNDHLPKGWTLNDGRPSRVISPCGKRLASYKEIIKFMRNNDYSKEDIDTLKRYFTSVYFEYDEALPDGWMCGKVKSTNVLYKFLSPEGDFFGGRREATKFMMQNKYKSSDIALMRDSFIKYENWEFANFPGSKSRFWMKKNEPKSNRVLFMSPDFEFFKKKGEILTYLKDRKYSPNEIEKISKLLNVTRVPKPIDTKSPNEEKSTANDKEQRLNSSDLSEVQWKSDSSLPNNWLQSGEGKHFRISNGKGNYFYTRKDAIDFMIKAEMSPIDIYKLWNNLHLEGWENDDMSLPTGWRRKYVEENESYHFLSPMMEHITSAESFLSFIQKSSDYSKVDAEKIKFWMSKSAMK